LVLQQGVRRKQGWAVEFRSVSRSLEDLTGKQYVEAVCRARAFLSGEDESSLRRLAGEAVDLFPVAIRKRLKELLPRVGTRVVAPLEPSSRGATTAAFQAVSRKGPAPLSGLGYYRVGEDGVLRVIAKSEHYHALLGHGFPGYALLDRARRLGIPNATHNNTRGHIVRKLEEELVREANGVGDDGDIKPTLESTAPDVLNRVLNIETGSLAVEAAVKMVLMRFYAAEAGGPKPEHEGKTPVILVVGDDSGSVSGNYHGTTTLTQVLRGMWPGLKERFESGRVFMVRAVRPNVVEDLEKAFSEYHRGDCRIAAFFHEIVMMNYGARLLSEKFLRRAYELCRANDVPAVADEIQSCMWYEGTFLFKRLGLKPSIVIMGKGFTGGEFPASRVISTPRFDLLPQFGALVTNGQEELASLAYLITMAWTRANGKVITEMGRSLESAFRKLAADFPAILAGIEGQGHLLGLRFQDIEKGKKFAELTAAAGFDISVQSYKASCPPVALTKLPVIVDEALVACISDRMREVLRKMAS